MDSGHDRRDRGAGAPTPTSAPPDRAAADCRSCVRISLYWLGLTAIDAAVGLFIHNRLEFDDFVPAGQRRHDRCS